MSAVLKFYILSTLFYLITLAAIYLLFSRLITGPANLFAPLLLSIIATPFVVFIVSLFLAHKYTGSAFHAIPPVFIVAFMLYIPTLWGEIKSEYIPQNYENTHFVAGIKYHLKGKRLRGENHGTFKYYDPENGKLRRECTWKHGVLNGYSAYYYPDGKKEMEGNMKAADDEALGMELRIVRYGRWIFYNEDGLQEEVREYDDTGKVRSSERYKLYWKEEKDDLQRICELKTQKPFTGMLTREGVLDKENAYPFELTARVINGYIDGEYTSYYPNGPIQIQAHYRMGTLQGEYRFFYASGKPKIRIDFVGGKRRNKAQWWYENGNLEYEVQYDDDGKRHGMCVDWYEDGTISTETMYKHGQKEGVTRLYDQEGRITNEKTYAEGQMTEKTTFHTDGRYEKITYRDEEAVAKYEYQPNGKLKSEWREATGYIYYNEQGEPIKKKN